MEAVRAFLAAARPSGVERTLAERRAAMDAFGAAAPLPDGWTREVRTLGGVAAERLVGPESAPPRVVLYLHGGAYTQGSPTSHAPLAARISRAVAAEAYVVDYRLAPEHPHPAAVDDAVAAFLALLADGKSASAIGVVGDSAGGGLSVAMCLKLKAIGAPQPGALGLISPWLDLALEGETIASRAEIDPLLTKADLAVHAAAYLAGADPKTPLASPLYGDLAGLPPTMMQTGEDEILLSDSESFVPRARKAGVDVTLETWPDMIHVWHAFYQWLPQSDEAIGRLGGWMKRRLR
jgi:acetyl esterase/lipase